MRLLCLDPEQDPLHGRWTRERWDRIVDLGSAGQSTREVWSRHLRCTVEPLPQFGVDDFAQVRRALSGGLGRVVDRYGLDWWELISIRLHEQIELLVRLEKLVASIPANSEVFVTRPGIHARFLRILHRRPVVCFVKDDPPLCRIGFVFTAACNFKAGQLLEILADKYDPSYRLRRFLMHKAAHVEREVVLLPVAHVTAANLALAYATMLPHQKFLLVATRQSGWVSQRPQNVVGARLSSYARSRFDEQQYQQLLLAWRRVESDLTGSPELGLLKQLGTFDNFSKLLREGLGIRNAWVRVFELEAVSAVFCTDNTNPYTHIPLLIARNRGVPTVACHHGALDGGYLFKSNHADVVLAKSRMEWHHLVNTCAVPRERVELGAPPSVSGRFRVEPTNWKSSIIFFSEPYELDYGRTVEIYREVVPSLLTLAGSMNCDFVLKLHPMENLRQRRKLLNTILTPRERSRVRIIGGVLSEELLARAIFVVTVQSTAALECTIRGIPAFLCAWLDYSHYGYLERFINFGAGIPLYGPGEIRHLAERLENLSPQPSAGLGETITPDKLNQLLTGSPELAAVM
jgi:hypothetical protein